MDPTIAKHIREWERKSSLRFIYHEDIYKKIDSYILPGPALETGSGAGFFKKTHKNTISSDILFLKHLDVVCDSLFIPFRNESLMNLVGIDIIHHFKKPAA